MRKIYKVTLTAEELAALTTLVPTGKSHAQKIKHANILFAANEHGKIHNSDIAKQFRCHANTVANIREPQEPSQEIFSHKHHFRQHKPSLSLTAPSRFAY